MRSEFFALLLVLQASGARAADIYESERDQVLATREASPATLTMTRIGERLVVRTCLTLALDSFGVRLAPFGGLDRRAERDRACAPWNTAIFRRLA
ncbi:MAG TPA: hypothetical protein VI356_15910 [Myxococcales bacterium]